MDRVGVAVIPIKLWLYLSLFVSGCCGAQVRMTNNNPVYEREGHVIPLPTTPFCRRCVDSYCDPEANNTHHCLYTGQMEWKWTCTCGRSAIGKESTMTSACFATCGGRAEPELASCSGSSCDCTCSGSGVSPFKSVPRLIPLSILSLVLVQVYSVQ